MLEPDIEIKVKESITIKDEFEDALNKSLFERLFNELKESPLELSESCDSNRFYDYGFTQRIAPYKYIESFSVDVREDVLKVEKALINDKYWEIYKK